jgi:tRNA threonylcarbamoyladenosine biosynthesis protein TsaE
MEIVFELKDIHAAAQTFLDHIKNKKVFAITGNMGAGKTTFVHALCDVKKVTSNVGSPTFSIINEYVFPGGKIFHIDLYRLKDEEEAVRAGLEDCLYSGEICFVEWPEKAIDIFPEETFYVNIDLVNESTRKITFKSNV